MSKKFTFTRTETNKKSLDLSSIGIDVNGKLQSVNSVIAFHANQITKALGYGSAFVASSIEEFYNRMYTILLDAQLIKEEQINTEITEFDETIYLRNKEAYDEYILEAQEKANQAK